MDAAQEDAFMEVDRDISEDSNMCIVMLGKWHAIGKCSSVRVGQNRGRYLPGHLGNQLRT